MYDAEVDSPLGSNDTFGPKQSGLTIYQCRVFSLYLDEDDNTSYGRIRGQILIDNKDLEGNKFTEIEAYPLDIYNYTLPAPNESVIVVKAENGQFFYSSIPPVNFIEQAVIDDEDNPMPIYAEEEEDPEENLQINVSSFKNFSINDDADEEIYGRTFTEDLVAATDVVQARKVREGDKIIQSRFGSSIKFTCKNELNETAWSLDGEDGQPVIVIRNGQDPEPNIATDNSFIYLLSDQSLDYGDFTPSPESANVSDPNDAYVGGQVVIGADRLTFISKTDDISLSSTGIISMATPKWAVDLDVLMDQVKALAEQVAALTKGEATFTTGVGPTGPATNAADVATIVQEISGLEQ